MAHLYGVSDARRWLDHMTGLLFGVTADEFVAASHRGEYENRPMATILMTVAPFAGLVAKEEPVPPEGGIPPVGV
jgi:hypothetical protein